MKIFRIALIIIVSTTLFSKNLQQSYLEANLPNSFEEFNKILQRDLVTYFSIKFKKPVIVKYNLLRDRPTQSGVAYPKFYAWINIYDSNKLIETGAIRVASIDKVRIEVTDYITQSKILLNPNLIESIFPRPLCNNIRDRAKFNKQH